MSCLRRDDGSAAIGVAVIVVLLVLGLASVVVGQVVVVRAQAQAAADAAALAAAPVTFARFGPDRTPRDAASRLASENGAELVSCDCPVDRSWSARTAVVRVRVGGSGSGGLVRAWPGPGPWEVQARAAAEFRPVALLESLMTDRDEGR